MQQLRKKLFTSSAYFDIITILNQTTNNKQQTGIKMAGKAKSVYLTVTLKGSMNSVFRKIFFNAKDFNEYVNSEDFKAKFPTTDYQIIKEVY